MTEMIELIRTLIKDKGQALGSDPQNETAQHDQRREELVYQARFTPPYALNVHVAQDQCNKSEGSRTAMRIPRRR